MNACPHCNGMLPEGFRAGDCPHCGQRVARRGRSLSGFSLPVPSQYASSRPPAAPSPSPRREVVEDRWDLADAPAPSIPPARMGSPLPPPPSISPFRAPTVPGPRDLYPSGALRAPPTGFGRPAPAVAPWSDQAIRSTAMLGVPEGSQPPRGLGRPPAPAPSSAGRNAAPSSGPYGVPSSRALRGDTPATPGPSAHATMAFGAAAAPDDTLDPSQDWLYDRGKVNRTLGFGAGEVQALLDTYVAPPPPAAAAPSATPPPPPPSPSTSGFLAGGTMSFGVAEVQAVLPGRASAGPEHPPGEPSGSPAQRFAPVHPELSPPVPLPPVPPPQVPRRLAPNRQTLQFDPKPAPRPLDEASALTQAVEDDPFPTPSPLPLTRRRGESVRPSNPPLHAEGPTAEALAAAAPPPAPPVPHVEARPRGGLGDRAVPTPPIPLVSPATADRPRAPSAVSSAPWPASPATTAPGPALAAETARGTTLPATDPDAPTRWSPGLVAGGSLVLGGALWSSQSAAHGLLFALTGAAVLGLSWAPLRGSTRSVAMLVPALPSLALASLATPSLSRAGAALATAWLALLATGLVLRLEAVGLARRLIVASMTLGGLWGLWEGIPALRTGPSSLQCAVALLVPVLAVAGWALRAAPGTGLGRRLVGVPTAWAALLGLALGLDGAPTAMVLGQALCLGALPGVVGVSLAAVLTSYMPSEPYTDAPRAPS